MANLLVRPHERVRLHFDGTLILSQGSFEAFELEVPEEQPSNWDGDFSQIQEYSDLDYTQFELSMGADFSLTKSTALTGAVTYVDMTDYESYVYGDATGSLLLLSLGVNSRF